MSIYTECGAAARSLLADPGLRPSNRGPVGIFTEQDVIYLAARAHIGGYDESDMIVATREASQIMGTLFRNQQVVRFGPVQIPGLALKDYLRLSTKIVYTGLDGPTRLETPNGVFEAFLSDDDTIIKQGRRLGTNRDDFLSWDEQEIVPKSIPRAVTAEQREIIRLRAETDTLREMVADRDAEIQRLHDQVANVITRDDVQTMIAEQIGGKSNRRRARAA